MQAARKSKQNPAPKRVEISQSQLVEISARLEQNTLTDEDRKLVEQILRSFLWLTQLLESSKISLKRLKRMLFGKKTESLKNIFPKKNKNDSTDSENAGANPGGVAANDLSKDLNDSKPGAKEPDAKNPPEKKPKKGHGKKPASDYTAAQKIFCAHEKLKPGDLCPKCCKGKLHNSIENGIFVRFTGQPPIIATIYETEKFRCGVCGDVFEATLPEGVPPVRWDESAKSMTSVLRYGHGVPHYRQEKLQSDLGTPISDSVLFENSEAVADAGLAPFKILMKEAANGKLIYGDDTTMRVLELMKENEKRDPEKERVGIQTTAFLSVTAENREIALFITGRNHTGENLVELLKQRDKKLSDPLFMGDGASKNVPAALEKIIKAVHLCCLTHGRRQFCDIESIFPIEVKYVLTELAKVYRADAIALETAMTDAERLEHHLKISKPVMEDLKIWCEKMINDHQAEPNGPLGIAIKYLLKRWKKLTGFLKIPGAPLSSDIVERLIKRFVLHRKNSMFYKTLHGAAIGDILMTLIHTAVRNRANPFDYLTELQRNQSNVFKNPEQWLPWNYRDTLSAIPQN